MDDTIKPKIIDLLDHHRLMTVATNRPEGWPQVTTVGYVNDGITLYFLCGPESQEIRIFRVESKVISVLDYSRGFGHSDLITV